MLTWRLVRKSRKLLQEIVYVCLETALAAHHEFISVVTSFSKRILICEKLELLRFDFISVSCDDWLESSPVPHLIDYSVVENLVDRILVRLKTH